MYIIDFVKNVFKKNNIGLIIWIILNTIMMTLLLGYSFKEMYATASTPTFVPYIIGTIVYLITIIIALSPIGEFILRLQNGCRKIKDENILQRVNPIFEEVYKAAKAKNPELPDNIKLYISNDETSNAFATGRKTVCITKGLLRSSDDEIRAILGHEFGHLANKDTDAILIVSVGNLIVSAIFVIYRIVIGFIIKFFGMIISVASGHLGSLIVSGLTKFFIDLVLVIAMKLWTKLGALLCLHASRKNEFSADEYSYNLGYGYDLCRYLDNIDPYSKSKNGLWATLNSTHPATKLRIEHLQELGCEYNTIKTY